MLVVEWSRLLLTARWYLTILVVMLVGALLLGAHTNVMVNGETKIGHGGNAELLALLPFAMYLGAIFASSAGLSLNRENATLDIAWTKPLSRPAIALRYIALDVAGVVVAFALALACTLLATRTFGFDIRLGPDVPVATALALGVSVMWYALLLALTAGFPTRAAAAAGIMWPIAFFVIVLGNLQGAVGAVGRALNYVNPLGYFTGVTSSNFGNARIESVVALPIEARVALVWILAALLCALATTLWSRREA